MDTMIRTQVSLTLSDRKTIDQMAGWHNVSLSEIIRRAVRAYSQDDNKKREERKALAQRLAGSLANSKTWKNVDAVAWQRKLRREKGI